MKFEILRCDIINEAYIVYCGQKVKVNCDKKCKKAWGINNRPKIHFSKDEDDFAFLSDCELGEAPRNPGTYEGEHEKPLSPNEFPNKWCVRECERCEKSKPGEWMKPLGIRNFEKRQYNQPLKHTKNA